MKFAAISLFLFTYFTSHAQVFVSPENSGSKKKAKVSTFEKFKNTKTIFVLSTVHEQQEYEKILHDVWKVTPYQLVRPEDFEMEEYLDGNHSIVQLIAEKELIDMKYGGKSTWTYSYLDFKIYDGLAISENLNRLSAKKRVNKQETIIAENSASLATVQLFAKDELTNSIFFKAPKTVIDTMYHHEVFFNYSLGMLKNYFQKVNNLIENEESYPLSENEYLPELKNLATNKLYIPSYMTIKYSALGVKDSEENQGNILEVIDNYAYPYEFISDKELSDKIINNEAFYYLRYARMNTARYLEVVNAISGEIVFANISSGLAYKIRPKQIKELNKSIEKAGKSKMRK